LIQTWNILSVSVLVSDHTPSSSVDCGQHLLFPKSFLIELRINQFVYLSPLSLPQIQRGNIVEGLLEVINASKNYHMMIKQSTYVVPASFWQKLDGIIFIILVFDLHQFPLSSSQIEDADIFDAISYRFDFKLGFFLASNPYAPVILASVKDNFISPVIVP
jgi:hypothetical protein